jgi:uncharacterized Zn-finger protein
MKGVPMSTVTINISLPTDNEGFLRRECPYCKRQFKLIIQSTDEEVSGDSGSEGDEKDIYCPYCGQSADRNSFWTEEQVRFMRETATQKVVAPMVDEFGDKLEKMSRKTDFIKFKAERTQTKRPVISPEPDDMIRMRPPCCGEDVKIEEDWEGPIHCVICGRKQDR